METVPGGLSVCPLQAVSMRTAVGFFFLELHILLLKNFEVLPTFKKGGKKHNHKGLLNLKA